MIKSSMVNKLSHLSERHQELSALLSEAEVIQDQKKFRDFSKEYSDLSPVVEFYERYKSIEQELEEANLMLEDSDSSVKQLAKEEIKRLKNEKQIVAEQLQILLLPKDPNDSHNIYLEVRAGTGGDEASVFAGDLFRMYSRYAETKGWQVELVSRNLGEHGGFKEVIARIEGKDVYASLKFESGIHRVQRVPLTESQGRVHTSACTVAVMPEVEMVDAVDINTNDLRIDTYRASGAGGQHVNKTDSAIRITHLPTGIVVECQDERSQHKNKAKALSLLQARILDKQQQEHKDKEAQTRRDLVGSGDRSGRIRTYNFSQGRLTDHRINLTLYKLSEVIEGNMDEVINSLRREHQADLLKQIGE